MAVDTLVSREEPKNRQRSALISTLFHIILILLVLFPLLTFPDPPPGQEGILVNLGLPDVGQGDNNAAPPQAAEPVVKPQEEAAPPKAEPAKPEPVKEKEVRVTEDPEALALKRKQEQEKKAQAEADAKRKAEEDAKRRAEEDAKRKAAEKAAAEKAAADKLKGDLAGALSGSGSGKGNTGTPGNQGDPSGDPNADKLSGVSTGVGTVGGGLGGRGVVAAPKITDNSQDRGKVVVRVCVDANGTVTSATYTQQGSTATSTKLRDLAIANARSWKFAAGADNQCGTITYNFQVQ